MSHLIGRRGSKETYPQPSSWGAATKVGLDTVQEALIVNAEMVLATAAQVPPIPRNLAGDPLQVTFPRWISGDGLRITWSSGALASLGVGSFGLIVPLVDIGGGFKYVDNGSQFPLLGVPGTFSGSYGLCAFVPTGVTSPPRVRLGLLLFDPNGGGAIQIAGTTINIAQDSAASVWLQAEAIPAPTIVQIPTVTLRDPPVPTT
jgi:hypothetical protein